VCDRKSPEVSDRSVILVKQEESIKAEPPVYELTLLLSNPTLLVSTSANTTNRNNILQLCNVYRKRFEKSFPLKLES